MARLAVYISTFLLLTTPLIVNGDDNPPTTPGLISANNVEVVTDSGEVLEQRLGIGDQIYIVNKPKEKKQGWYRISKSETDTNGIGWVETKFVRSFRRWEAPQDEPGPSRAEQMGEKTVIAPDVEPILAKQIGILPFISADPDDPVAKWMYDEFSSKAKENKKFQFQTDSLSSDKVDLENPQTIQTVINKRGLDGLFVGNLSGSVGSSRLLQVKYYSKGRESATMEKVKKIPKDGNLKALVDSLAASCVSAVPSK